MTLSIAQAKIIYIEDVEMQKRRLAACACIDSSAVRVTHVLKHAMRKKLSYCLHFYNLNVRLGVFAAQMCV